MGIYLLAAIILVLFIVFVIDLIRDSREHNQNYSGRPHRFPRYGEEFGEDEFDFMSYDDYRYHGLDDVGDEEFSEEENIDLYNDRYSIQEDDDFHLNFKDEFGNDILHDLNPEDVNDDWENDDWSDY